MSFTAENPVAWSDECQACRVTIGTDHPVPELVQMFNERHRSCGEEAA